MAARSSRIGSLVDVASMLAGLGVRGKRQGGVWSAKCPLPDHDDREPSWTIVDRPGQPQHGSWYCFGCRRGGGPVQLVARVRGVDYPEARAWLTSCEREVRGEVAPVVSLAWRIPSRLGWPVDGAVREYDDWPERARKHWEQTRGLPPELARRVGATATAESARCPRSVVFPVVSYGALRTWVARSYVPGGRKHDQARRSEGAQPDLALWGEPWIDPQLGPALVCEGVFDALSLTACGLPNALAVLGASSITPAKVAAVARCDSVVVCTDNDAAGEMAWEHLRGALARHVSRIGRARPPDGHDWGSAPVDDVVGIVDGARWEVER